MDWDPNPPFGMSREWLRDNRNHMACPNEEPHDIHLWTRRVRRSDLRRDRSGREYWDEDVEVERWACQGVLPPSFMREHGAAIRQWAWGIALLVTFFGTWALLGALWDAGAFR